MSATVKDPWAGRSGWAYLRAILRGGHAGDPRVWVRDVGDDPIHSAKIGGFALPHGLEPQREAIMTPHGRGLVYPPPLLPSGRCSEGGRAGWDYSVNFVETEFGCALHCYMENSGYMFECDGMDRDVGVRLVVGKGGGGTIRSMGGIRGGKGGRVWWSDRRYRTHAEGIK